MKTEGISIQGYTRSTQRYTGSIPRDSKSIRRYTRYISKSVFRVIVYRVFCTKAVFARGRCPQEAMAQASSLAGGLLGDLSTHGGASGLLALKSTQRPGADQGAPVLFLCTPRWLLCFVQWDGRMGRAGSLSAPHCSKQRAWGGGGGTGPS